MRVKGYVHAGGRHAASVALRNLLTHAGVVAPHTAAPPSEPLVFGIAGGIAAGYSFCPSVVRYGGGSGVWVVGRHKAYATGAAHGSDRSAVPVTISLDDLAAARRGVCSHKNRTLTIDPPTRSAGTPPLTLPRLRDAVLSGLRACAAELLTPRIKTFGLPGL